MSRFVYETIRSNIEDDFSDVSDQIEIHASILASVYRADVFRCSKSETLLYSLFFFNENLTSKEVIESATDYLSKYVASAEDDDYSFHEKFFTSLRHESNDNNENSLQMLKRMKRTSDYLWTFTTGDIFKFVYNDIMDDNMLFFLADCIDSKQE